ncbi:lactonase family protein [Nocardiopsis ansamitocini]|uniref:6-phosphogluconolactonase n=1 Tax=Nocardiopsis ansamitocini TaxID=1670832 RepID=A0A9W6UJ58_9ACTN|nr:lactonase family protein [Nocardiopsis ansamitocini]GLU47720.1 hypothetical protein Nans01_20710 [Nocardiopsis ansamitocini]
MTQRLLLWIGSYTSGSAAAATGVQRVWLDPADGRLSGAGTAAPAVDPSFLATDGAGCVFAVNETMEGGVTGFVRTGEAALAESGATHTGGSSPCHLLVHPAGRHVITANYGDGSLSVHPITADGVPGTSIQRVEHTGSGPDRQRQEGSHAHSVCLAPGGTHLLVADLGTDELRCHPFDPRSDQPLGAGHLAAQLEPGTGPRHLAVHRSGHIYVAGELDARVHILRWDPDTATAQPLAALPATEDAPDVNYPAEIALSADGSRLYLSNRGPDSITTFAVTEDGAMLTRLAQTPTGGTWPRHFAQVGDYIVVANQNSATVTVLPVDPANGIPGPVRHSLELPSPVCVLPAV